MCPADDHSAEIFVVDDDPAVRDALAVVFELEGLPGVAPSPTARRSLPAARNRTPACVLLDVHMPGRSGLDILDELGRALRAPVFMISGQGDIPMAVEAIKQGAHDFIEKPFDADTVRHAGSRRAGGQRQQGGRQDADALSRRSQARSSSRRGNARFWSASRSALPTRKPDASLASARARSRCIAPASWRSSARATRPTSCASSIRIPAGIIDRHQECYR